MQNTDYMAVFGGQDLYSQFSDILFYNIDRKIWESFPTKMKLPAAIADVQETVVLKLDTTGCEMMLLENYPGTRLHICTGDYSWTWLETAGKNSLYMKYVTVGTNELLPCGIE